MNNAQYTTDTELVYSTDMLNDRSFYETSVLNNILLKKRSLPNSKCQICGINKCDRMNNRVRHLMHHFGAIPYYCLKCPFLSMSEANLYKHLVKHVAFDSDEDVKLGKLKTVLSKKLHDCSLCELSFKSHSNLVMHYLHHLQLKSFKCIICELYFFEEMDWRIHLNLHYSERCNICRKYFGEFNTNFVTHVINHSSHKYYRKFPRYSISKDSLPHYRSFFKICYEIYSEEFKEDVTLIPKETDSPVTDSSHEIKCQAKNIDEVSWIDSFELHEIILDNHDDVSDVDNEEITMEIGDQRNSVAHFTYESNNLKGKPFDLPSNNSECPANNTECTELLNSSVYPSRQVYPTETASPKSVDGHLLNTNELCDVTCKVMYNNLDKNVMMNSNMSNRQPVQSLSELQIPDNVGEIDPWKNVFRQNSKRKVKNSTVIKPNLSSMNHDFLSQIELHKLNKRIYASRIKHKKEIKQLLQTKKNLIRIASSSWHPSTEQSKHLSVINSFGNCENISAQPNLSSTVACMLKHSRVNGDKLSRQKKEFADSKRKLKKTQNCRKKKKTAESVLNALLSNNTTNDSDLTVIYNAHVNNKCKNKSKLITEQLKERICIIKKIQNSVASHAVNIQQDHVPDTLTQGIVSTKKKNILNKKPFVVHISTHNASLSEVQNKGISVSKDKDLNQKPLFAASKTLVKSSPRVSKALDNENGNKQNVCQVKECVVALEKLPDSVLDRYSIKEYKNQHQEVEKQKRNGSPQISPHFCSSQFVTESHIQSSNLASKESYVHKKVAKQNMVQCSDIQVSSEGQKFSGSNVFDPNLISQTNNPQIIPLDLSVYSLVSGNTEHRKFDKIQETVSENAVKCNSDTSSNQVSPEIGDFDQPLLVCNQFSDIDSVITLAADSKNFEHSKLMSTSISGWHETWGYSDVDELLIENRTKDEILDLRHRISCIRSRLENLKQTEVGFDLKDLRVSLIKMPDTIYEKHLKEKPIMLSSILPVICDVQSISKAKDKSANWTNTEDCIPHPGDIRI